MMMKSPRSPRSPRSVRIAPSLMTIPEGHEACCNSNTTTDMMMMLMQNSVASPTTTTTTAQQQVPQPFQHHQLNDPVFLINTERSRMQLDRLTRHPTLDALAYRHASLMAQRCDVHHSVNAIEALQERLSHQIVGENVQRGDSILSMHYETILSNNAHCVNRANLLSPYFTEIGSATVMSAKDGKLYCCQLFRGSS